MTLRTRWINFLYTIATGSKKFRNLFTPIGALFYGLLIFFFIIIALYLDRALTINNLFPKTLMAFLSLPVFLIAFLLIGWSVYHFFKVKGTPVPFNPPPKLVTTGPYAYSRNPMLTGIFVLLFGLGVYYGSISLVFVFTPLFILLNIWELKSIEEPELIKRLGEEYIEYRKSTPMFFTRLIALFKRKNRSIA